MDLIPRHRQDDAAPEPSPSAPTISRDEEALFGEPVRIEKPARQKVPLVFSSPHSGRLDPAAFVTASNLDAVTLRRSEDSFVEEIFGGVVELGAPLIHARFPRAYLDANREPYELDPAMFAEPLFQVSEKLRDGWSQTLSEAVATFGLIGTILGSLKFRPDATPMLVGLYITAAYWFTASTSFANPAVTVARSLSDTFAGIAPSSAPLFIAGQMAGALFAALLFGWLLKERTST